VAAIYSVGLMQMELWEQKFAELYPEVAVRVEYLHPDDVYAQIEKGEADLGLVSFPRNGGEFVSLDWQEQPMLLVVPPDHRLAGRNSVPLAELAGEDYVAFTQELTIRREVDRWLKRARVAANIVREFDNIETIKRAIEIGSGVALLPGPTAWQEISSGTLVAIPIADADLVRPLGIIHKRQARLPSAARKFVELLQHESPAVNGRPPREIRRRPSNGVAHRAGRAGRRRRKRAGI
jgi:DNA-binding transcriptional LysR family regulator